MAIDTAINKSPEGPDSDVTYMDYAWNNSLDMVNEECEGLADASDAWSAKECAGMNSLLYLLEDMIPRYFGGFGPPGFSCSQFAVAGAGTTDSGLIHGRNMDWLPIEFIMNNTLLIVRRPDDGLGHVSMMWPSMVSTLSGMNEAGVAIANDELACREGHRDLQGVPSLQLLTEVLTKAHDLEEALAIIEATDHASCEIFLVSYGPTRTAAVVEKSATSVSVTRMNEDDVLFTTNHFLDPEMIPHIQGEVDLEDLTNGSITRWVRLQERLTGESLPPHPGLSEDDPDYAYGKIDPLVAIDILRDPLDLRPDQDRYSFEATEYTEAPWALGHNTNVQSIVFAPEDLRFWLATGWDDEYTNPIYNPYVGFDLSDLLDGNVNPDLVPTYDPPYNGSYGNGIHPDE